MRPEDWVPVGVEELEDNAVDVIRSEVNQSVVAGPGAGKTELLAQRACYLLQTGLSPSPRRILAISFKRDAASNLAARVRQRCHRQNAARFDSMTFDAFAKGLIDRFGQLLPNDWRPTPDYDIVFPSEKSYIESISQTKYKIPKDLVKSRTHSENFVRAFERDYLLGSPLSIDDFNPLSEGEWVAKEYWKSSLNHTTKSRLSFAMIGRLAELLFRLNQPLRHALRLTYSHLFLDEFQDTTHTQYDLVLTLFNGSDTVITAVGDEKQQIMRWAMAMDDPFSVFEGDFKTTRTKLHSNYRSSPDLVYIQHILAKALDSNSARPISKSTSSISGVSCAILNFETPEQEAERIAILINKHIKQYQLEPCNFGLLVRQKAGDYAELLKPAFATENLAFRNEACKVGDMMLQDLLSEEASQLMIGIIRVAMTAQAANHWSDCMGTLCSLRGIEPDDQINQVRLARELDTFARRLAQKHSEPTSLLSNARMLVNDVLKYIGRENLVSAHPSYCQGDWLEKILESIAIHLAHSSRDSNEWSAALDAYEGVQSVPLMTIHKSKGLEFHTVIFIGLEDGAWWSFGKDKREGTANFFVAFTRAQQRVVFTYCASRSGRSNVAPLYSLLKRAGVKEYKKV